MSIEITGSAEKVYSEILGEVYKTLHAEARTHQTWAVSADESETIADWLWKHYASTQQYAWQESTATFAADYDTWEDILDAYREDAFSTYEEGRIG